MNTAAHTNNAPADILSQLGFLDEQPPDQPTKADNHAHPTNRRRHTRVPTQRTVQLIMLAGNQPLGRPFKATATDISSHGVRLSGNAPLLTNARAVIQLESKDGRNALLGATIKHSTFGSHASVTKDNAASAGLEFYALDHDTVATHFTGPDGSLSLAPREH